ncbi:hypothetical protein [Arsenophonus nasoniae]|uniref:Uncharacterized protein n=1 Tax=Arsenophonus nasoniae TaxID=638 RepID=A0AA95GJ04_9GAMM|nr:hypothetical protein [Arsenophonus nasoniae]WGL96739.1 hypothetical protein QE207_09505 [Arsenophonus nasoniae]
MKEDWYCGASLYYIKKQHFTYKQEVLTAFYHTYCLCGAKGYHIRFIAMFLLERNIMLLYENLIYKNKIEVPNERWRDWNRSWAYF